MEPQYWIICYDNGPDSRTVFSTIVKANDFIEAVNHFNGPFGDRILSVMPINDKRINDWEYISDTENNFRDKTSCAFQ